MIRLLLISFLICFIPMLLKGQQQDTTRGGILNSRVSREIIDAVTVEPSTDTKANVKSEYTFVPYQGKIIRKISVRHIGFERSIRDTTRTIKNRITNIANALHSDTQERVIYDNIFFNVNDQLNPYLLADNERYLRDLDFILDSKIKVKAVIGASDSVDVEVITRDVFSLGGRVKLNGIDGLSLGVYDANLFGWGQRVQTEVLFDRERNPLLAYSFLYRKVSVGGTLINATFGYTQLNNARSIGEENEFAYYFRLDRPLVSPYSRMAGGLEISRNYSNNVYKSPDSLFVNYRYNVQDIWFGYNIGIKTNMNNRKRHFVALRYGQQLFDQLPSQLFERDKRIYNDQRFLLTEFTFYNQNFYKTSYVYGFGRTEDIPYGRTINVTTGWSEELGRRRSYLGTYAVQRIVLPSGRFYDVEAGIGSFLKDNELEDGVVYLNAAYYSKLYEVNQSKVRHLFAGGFARAFNNKTRELLTINDDLQGFRPDSLYGYQRLFIRNETTVFTPWQLAGFRFAPFLSLEGAFFQEDKNRNLFKDIYWGTTGGIRIRNENLIFGTVEFRVFYFPTTVAGVDPVSFKVTTNVRIKYSGSFIRPPDFVRYN